MSFLSDKKQEHETAAEKALADKNFSKALFHTAKAAEFGLKIAEQTEGKVAQRYVEDAFELITLAEDLKKKAAQSPKAGKDNKDKKPAPAPAESKNGDEDQDWLVTEKPKVRLSDIAGMADVKTKLADMVIEPLKHTDKAKEWGVRAGGGILLFGPPGNGKTTLGKAVACELDAPFFYATGAEIRSKWHGESEQRLRSLIQATRQHKVSVLFFDDVDGLLPRRGGNSVVDNRIVVQFLNEIGGFQESENTLLLLAATNNPWDIDEAVFRTGRFDEKIFVGLPDHAAREFIIKKNLGSAPVDPSFDAAALAQKLEGYVGSDIVAIVQSAKRAGFRQSVSGGPQTLTTADFENALKTIPSSATPKMMKQYEEFAKARFV